MRLLRVLPLLLLRRLPRTPGMWLMLGRLGRTHLCLHSENVMYDGRDDRLALLAGLLYVFLFHCIL
jgi:hypothetical protein